MPSPAKAAEKLRLAEALRANLRRRKAARNRPDEGLGAEADLAPGRDEQARG